MHRWLSVQELTSASLQVKTSSPAQQNLHYSCKKCRKNLATEQLFIVKLHHQCRSLLQHILKFSMVLRSGLCGGHSMSENHVSRSLNISPMNPLVILECEEKNPVMEKNWPFCILFIYSLNFLAV